MDDLYYRKERTAKPLIDVVKKLAKQKTLRYVFVVAVPILAFMMFSEKGIVTHLKLQSQKEEMLVKVQKAQDEQRRLQQLSQSLDSDPAMIEKVAREKFGMIREGETVYKIKKQ
jgi:cell division protein FtsB